MNIDVYNTHIEVYPYSKGDLPVIEHMYTAQDKFSGNDFPCGYLIDGGKLYLARGTSITRLEDIIGVKANYINKSDEYDDMSKKHYALYDPRNELQEQSIAFLEDKKNGHQLSLNLSTGFGKSFCVAAAVTNLKIKALIITPNDGLKLQWIQNTFMKMFNYKEDDLCNISGSAIMNAIVNDKIKPYDVYFVNHQTLQSYLSQTNGYMLQQFFKKIKVGVKVYDESHMDFGNILLMDFFSNTDRTWYLTATFDRSDASESACFKRAFQTVIPFGGEESKALKRKHVIYHTVNVYSNISPREKSILMGYPGFSSIKYGRYAFFTDKTNTAYNAILNILKKTKDVEGKTLIFVPIIEGVDEVVRRLRIDFPEKSVTAYHSKMDKEEKESGLIKKDIIVSTIKSCGTGKDIKGLRTLICAEPIASKVVTEQMFGRLREYAPDKDTYFWDIVDRSIPPLTWWHRARMKKIESLAKQIININM